MAAGLLQFIRLSRLFDVVFPIASLFLGLAVSGNIENHKTLYLVAIVTMLNSVAMVWNDIEDRQIDADNGRPELANSNTRTISRLKTYVVLLISVCLVLALVVGVETMALTLVTICVIWIYNTKPFQVSRRPIASLVALSGAGAFLPYLFGLSLGGASSYIIIAGIFWWVGRISLSVLKDYKDARGDARYHKQTFLLRYGSRWVARVSVACLLIGYGGFILMMSNDEGTILSLATLGVGVIVAVYMRRKLFDKTATYAQFDSVFRTTAQYQLLLDAGIILWLI